MINLVRNYSLSPNPDGDGYLQLELRHNRLNDPEIDHILWGVASFRLEDLKLENPDLKGLKIKVRSPYGTEVRTCDFEKRIQERMQFLELRRRVFLLMSDRN